jgi:DNA polymerase-1
VGVKGASPELRNQIVSNRIAVIAALAERRTKAMRVRNYLRLADVIGLVDRIDRARGHISIATSETYVATEHLIIAFDNDDEVAAVHLQLAASNNVLGDIFGALANGDVLINDALQVLTPLARTYGLRAGSLIDVGLAARLLDGGRLGRNDFTTERLAARELGISLPPAKRTQASSVAPHEPARHAAVLPAVWAALRPKLESADLANLATLEWKLAPVIIDMAAAGLPFDKAAWTVRVDEARHDARALKPSVETAFRAPGLAHDAVLAGLHQMGIPVSSTKAEVLAPYKKNPAVAELLEFRRVDAFANSTGAQILRALETSTNGRVHAAFDQLGTVTGRITTANPSLLNLPKTDEVRRCVVPAPGHVFVVADYAHCQLRIVAHHICEDKLIKVFEENGCPHRLTAGALFDKSESEVTTDERNCGKVVNFGLLFGMGASALLEYAAGYDVILSLEQAEEIKGRFLACYPGIAGWHAAHQNGTAGDVVSGMGRVCGSAADADDFCARLAFAVQATEAEAMKSAMVELYDELDDYGARLVLVAYDELLLECPEALAAVLCDRVDAVMTSALQRLVPTVKIKVDVDVRTTWAKESTVALGTAPTERAHLINAQRGSKE